LKEDITKLTKLNEDLNSKNLSVRHDLEIEFEEERSTLSQKIMCLDQELSELRKSERNVVEELNNQLRRLKDSLVLAEVENQKQKLHIAQLEQEKVKLTESLLAAQRYGDDLRASEETVNAINLDILQLNSEKVGLVISWSLQLKKKVHGHLRPWTNRTKVFHLCLESDLLMITVTIRKFYLTTLIIF
jgi:chromosome segregation ATPase